ncbi:MAG: protein kinase, partial [Acidobacteria bacterium]|nr:protein kinase [Acidobacteriota bacterium]
MEESSSRDQQVMAIASAALRHPPAEREAYLRLACNGDKQLSAEVTETLEWQERMGSFLLHPMVARKDFARPFKAGQVVAERFEVLREIGEGGMGIVYEAFDRKRNQRIAIKSAKPGFHRFLSPELEGALQVRHPNICLVNEIHTAKTDKGEVDFLTMELLQGETLSAHLRAQGKLSEKAAYVITRQLCAGLAEAHRSGIIHRDLKSANVFLCPVENSGVRVVITDFGLAASHTTATEFGGTPQYMAPELWCGKKASKASDIYSLGVILYEMVAGKLPFPEESGIEILRKTPSAPGTFHKGLGSRWDRIILQCLNPSPDARPQEATAVFAALERKPLRKLWIPIAAALVVFAGALTLKLRAPVPGPRIRTIAVLPLENLSGDPNQEFFSDGTTAELIAALAQIHALRVISHLSVTRYKGTTKSLSAIGRELRADAIVEGSVRR